MDGRPLDPNTGLLSLAATARRGLAAEQLWDHTQRLSGGLEVLVGLGNAEQSAGLAAQWDTLGRAFASLGKSPHPQLAADVIADCGRIGPESASVALFPHAALVLLIAGDEPEQIARVRDRALALTARLHGTDRGMSPLAQPLLGVLLVAQAQGAAKIAGQVNDMLVASRAGARVVGVIAHDPLGAEQLAGRRRGRVERSLLVRSVRKIATDLHQQYGAAWAPATAQPQPQQPPTSHGQDQVRSQGPGPAPVAGQPSGPAEPFPSGPAPHAPAPHTPTGRLGAGQDRTPPPQQGPPPHRPPPPRQNPPPVGPDYGTPRSQVPGGQTVGVRVPGAQTAGVLPPVQTPPKQPSASPAPGGPAQGEPSRGLKGFRGRRRQAAPALAPTPPVSWPGSGEQPRNEGAVS